MVSNNSPHALSLMLLEQFVGILLFRFFFNNNNLLVNKAFDSISVPVLLSDPIMSLFLQNY